MSGKVFEYMAIMDRIKNVTQCRTQQELAQFFDVSQSCISEVLPGFPWVTPVRNWPGRGLDRHRRSRWLS